MNEIIGYLCASRDKASEASDLLTFAIDGHGDISPADIVTRVGDALKTLNEATAVLLTWFDTVEQQARQA